MRRIAEGAKIDFKLHDADGDGFQEVWLDRWTEEGGIVRYYGELVLLGLEKDEKLFVCKGYNDHRPDSPSWTVVEHEVRILDLNGDGVCEVIDHEKCTLYGGQVVEKSRAGAGVEQFQENRIYRLVGSQYAAAPPEG